MSLVGPSPEFAQSLTAQIPFYGQRRGAIGVTG
jgi:hypothetical protein